MEALKKLKELYQSSNLQIRVRATRMMLARQDTPTRVIIDILEKYHDLGLGAEAERVLVRRKSPDLFDPMIRFLRHPRPFLREAACTVLGEIGDRRATRSILPLLSDPAPMTQRAAIFALCKLRDPSARKALKVAYGKLSDQDPIERSLIKQTLDDIDVETQE